MCNSTEDYSFDVPKVEFWQLEDSDLPIRMDEYVSFLGFRSSDREGDSRYFDVPLLLAERAVVH